MSQKETNVLLAHHLKSLKLPTILREYESQAKQCAQDRSGYDQFLYPQEEARDQRFSLDGHPHLKHVIVQAPDLGVYGQLMGGAR